MALLSHDYAIEAIRLHFHFGTLAILVRMFSPENCRAFAASLRFFSLTVKLLTPHCLATSDSLRPQPSTTRFLGPIILRLQELFPVQFTGADCGRIFTVTTQHLAHREVTAVVFG